MEFDSKLINDAVASFSKLPSIGKKTALRLVLHILKQENSLAEDLASSLVKLKEGVKYCTTCHMAGDSEDCFCKSSYLDPSIICVVEDIQDVIAIKNTGHYSGFFHVLGGIISPINGIGPDDLKISSLLRRVKESGSEIKEVIMALPATMEGDTTTFYIAKKLQGVDVKVSSIARGVPVGSELEYTDEITLGRSIMNRVNYSVQ